MKKNVRKVLAVALLAIMALALLAGCSSSKKVEWIFRNELDYDVRVKYDGDNLDEVIKAGEEKPIELTVQASKDRAEFRIEKADDPSCGNTNKSYAILEVGGIFQLYSLDGKTPNIFQIAYNSPLYKG